MRSMTGYGEGTAACERLEVTATLRTVNHRFRDVAVKMPEDFRALEPKVAEAIAAGVHRGRVEARIEVRALVEPEVRVDVRREVARSYLAAAGELGRELEAPGRMGVVDLLRLPEVTRIEVGAEAADEEVARAFGEAVEQAVLTLNQTRAAEGQRMIESIRGIVAELESVVAAVVTDSVRAREGMEVRLRERLAELLEEPSAVGEDRLAQEVAILVDKADVREEVERLQAHLEGTLDAVTGDGPHGKRLDFLVQELLRELNTIGSKCRDAAVAKLVIEGKLLTEQLREQAQNVE